MVESKFKNTDIGLLPDDWDIAKIEDVANVIGGGTPSTGNSRFWNGDINWFTPTEVGKKKYLFESKRKITELGLINSSGTILPVGTILITTRAGIGDVGILKIESATNQGFQSLVPLSGIVEEYLYYIASTLKPVLLKNSSGSTFLEISPSKVKAVQIPIPPLDEQKEIAKVLSETDAWINSLENLIAKKRKLKVGAMQTLFTPKKDWELKKLGEISEIIIGLTYSPKDVRDYGKLVLRSSNIQKGKLSFENNVFVEMDLPNRVIVKENDLLVCVRNGSKQLIGKCALIDKANEGNAFGAFMTIIRSRFNRYIHHYFSSNHIQNQIDENLGATINQLTNATLKSFDIFFPKSIIEQSRIANLLSDMDAEINSLEEKLNKAKQIKQGMMQQLLTGKIRLIHILQTS